MRPTEIDVIFALATPPARAALHLHRISGPGCFAALLPRLRRVSGAPIARVPARGAHHLLIVDAAGVTIDDAVVTIFPGPNSFTGEDTLEISTHGNPVIAANLQRTLRAIGLREAKAGEFTQRAFLNGRLDLAQAEAIGQLIDAETEGGVALARGVSEGSLSAETQSLRQALVSVLAHLEAHIDFSEDEVGAFEAAPHVRALEDLAVRLVATASTYEQGRVVRNGLRVALCGRPNAGKSTLFNALLRSDRAIVTDVPGTTRDVLEERLRVSGRDFVLSDTAGLRETDDTVERMGVERSRRALAASDVACLVVDGSRDDDDVLHEFEALRRFGRSTADYVLVLNKNDAWNDPHKAPRLALATGCDVVSASASKGVVEDCEAALVMRFDALSGAVARAHGAVLISARQRDKVTEAHARVREAIALLEAGDYPEKTASTLLAANRALVEVVGEISTDDVLGAIFSSFCIGK